MSEAKHTPGPWQVTINRPAGETLYGVRTHTHTGITIGREYFPDGHEPATDADGYFQPDARADIAPYRVDIARLFAAAPDLLAALEAMVAYQESTDLDDEPEDGEYGDGKRALLAARAALALAKPN
jgi:hypothetical protein